MYSMQIYRQWWRNSGSIHLQVIKCKLSELRKKSFLVIFPCLIENICSASIVDRDHKVCTFDVVRMASICPDRQPWLLVSPDRHGSWCVHMSGSSWSCVSLDRHGSWYVHMSGSLWLLVRPDCHAKQIYRQAVLSPSGFITMRIYRQWRRNPHIGNNGNWRCVTRPPSRIF